MSFPLNEENKSFITNPAVITRQRETLIMFFLPLSRSNLTIFSAIPAQLLNPQYEGRQLQILPNKPFNSPSVQPSRSSTC